MVLSRGGGSSSQELVHKSDALYRNRANIYFALSDMGTDVSSTKVRLAVKRKKSIKYLVADAVIDYIRSNCLYSEK